MPFCVLICARSDTLNHQISLHVRACIHVDEAEIVRGPRDHPSSADYQKYRPQIPTDGTRRRRSVEGCLIRSCFKPQTLKDHRCRGSRNISATAGREAEVLRLPGSRQNEKQVKQAHLFKNQPYRQARLWSSAAPECCRSNATLATSTLQGMFHTSLSGSTFG